MTTRLFLVRHGETDWNRLGLFQGRTDVPMNATGHDQVDTLAARLTGVRFDAVYTSPLRRARDTAARVAGAAGDRVVAIPELAELCYGFLQGSGAGVRNCSAIVEQRFRERPWDVEFPGGESLDDVARRAGRAWDRIVASNPGRTVLVSAHGHVNRVILTRLGAWGRDQFWSIPQPNCACYRIEYGRTGRAPTVSEHLA